jgi:glutathione S-transferase
MKLYYTPGTSSLFPHIVLHEAGLAFEKIKVDEHTKLMDNGADYRTVNSLGYVPALELDDGTVLTEGTAIVQYIADQVPAKQLAPPNGTLERAKLQSWLTFIATEIQMGCFCPLFHPTTSDAAKTMYRKRLASRLSGVDRHLSQQQYMLGERFSLADAYLLVVLNWARPLDIDLSPACTCAPQTRCCTTRSAGSLASRGPDPRSLRGKLCFLRSPRPASPFPLCG